jgi:hypothetical protein
MCVILIFTFMKKSPTQKTGGRYESAERSGFVEASPSRVFRDGDGDLFF